MPVPPLVAFLSFRFGPHDGVSVEARKWASAFERLGFSIRWVAGRHDFAAGGSESADAANTQTVAVIGLGADSADAPSRAELEAALDGCHLVVVENLLSLPLNPSALEVVAAALAGRAAIVHHHDLPWQRARFAAAPPPPHDPAWAHVTINRRSAVELHERAGITATTIYNRFAPPSAPPREMSAGVPVPSPLLLHPTRAIPRKNVPAAIRLAEDLGGTYWLFGPPEDDFDEELSSLVAAARCPVRRGPEGRSIEAAYDECDLVVLPSTWEGFGNATVESALARRPLAIGRYPVADELREFGFDWFDHDDPAAIRTWLDEPDPTLVDHNERVARMHFLLDGLPDALRPVLERVL